MPAPVPNIKPLRVPYGTQHFKFVGPIGTVGPTLVVDLTDIPERIRNGAGFRDQLYISLQALSVVDGIVVTPSPVTILPAAPATPEYFTIGATSLNIAGEIQVLVEAHHTIGR